jgi:sporulation protein YlmC with PRC-barrel domain
MRLDRLRNLAVIDPATACQAGVVTDYWVDAASGQVAALVIRPIDVDLPQHVCSRRVAHIGHDAVMLSPAAAVPAGRDEIPDTWIDRRHLSSLTVHGHGR